MIKYERRIKRVCDYIQMHLDKDITVSELSDVAALSKYHFHRIFSAYTGVNIVKYIQLLRLKRASYQLAFEHELKVIDIAMDAHFDSPEAFSRAFKRSFNQTPSEFRKFPDWENWHKKLEFSIPKGDIKMDVQIVTKNEENIAYLSHIGAPDRILETAAEFIEWRKETGLSPVKSSNTYGIPHADPELASPEEFRFDLCGTIERDVPKNKQGVKTSVIPAGRCAVIRHKGSHDQIRDVVCTLYSEWLPESSEETRDFPVYFHYLNFIHEVNESELLTDIYLPLK